MAVVLMNGVTGQLYQKNSYLVDLLFTARLTNLHDKYKYKECPDALRYFFKLLLLHVSEQRNVLLSRLLINLHLILHIKI